MKRPFSAYIYLILLSGKINGQTVCQIVQEPIKYIDYITQNPKLIFNNNSNPTCVLALIDSLSNHFIKTNNLKALIALESIGKVSDGYLSEHYEKISQNIFYNQFETFLHYLYQQQCKNKTPSCFEFYLTVSFALDVLENQYTLSDLTNKIQKMAIKNNVSEDERKYIIDFVKKINPQKYK